MEVGKLSKNQLENYKDDIRQCLMQLESIHDAESANCIINDMGKYIDDGTAIIICAIDDNHLIGLIWAYERLISNEKRFHVNYFVVDKKYRNKGLGQQLFCEISNIAKERNIKKIELIVNSKNENAINFYKHHDFEVEKLFLCKTIDEEL